MFAKLRRALRQPGRVIRLAVRVRARAGRARAGRAARARARRRRGGRRSATDVVEYAVYGAPGELPEPAGLRAAAGEALVEISTSEIPDDWHERWKRFHRPVLIEPPRRRPARAAGARAARAPAVGARRAIARGEVAGDRDRSRAGVRHRRARDARACAWSCCSSWRPHERRARAAARRRHRLGGARDRRRRARLRAGARRSTTSARASTAARENAARQRRRDRGAPLRPAHASALPWLGDGRRAGGPIVVLANLLRPLLLELARTMPARPPHLIAGGLLRERGRRGRRRVRRAPRPARARAARRAASGPRCGWPPR